MFCDVSVMAYVRGYIFTRASTFERSASSSSCTKKPEIIRISNKRSCEYPFLLRFRWSYANQTTSTMDPAVSALLPRPVVLEVGEVEFTDREKNPKPEEEKQWLWDPIGTQLQAIATSALNRPKKLLEDTFGNETTTMDTSEVLQRAKSCLGLHTRKSIGVVVYPQLSEACEELRIKQNEILSIRSGEEGPTSENRTTRVDIEASFLPSEPFMTESGTVAFFFQVFLSVFRFFRSTSIPGEERGSAQLHQYTSQVTQKLSLGFRVRPNQEGSFRDASLITGPEGKSSTRTISNSTAPSVEGPRSDDSRADSQTPKSYANTESDNESAARTS
jgi:hypothetical protein